jgi:outer membrane protein OmpA-like peptidoglycan-associated protein
MVSIRTALCLAAIVSPALALAQGGRLSAEGGGLSTQGGALSSVGSGLHGTAQDLNARETDLGTALTLAADVLFDFGSAELKPGATPTLIKLLAPIRQKNPRQVQVHGYTDAVGGEAYNLKLSQRRAEAVTTWLAQNGVSPGLLTSHGFGKSNPVAPNSKPDGSDNPEGRQQNRRVEILLAKAFSAVKPLPGPRDR